MRKVKFRSEIDLGSSRSLHAMRWVNEINEVKRIVDLRMSRSIPGNTEGDLKVFDANVAGGLMKIINGDFKRSLQ